MPGGDPDEIVKEGRTAEFEALIQNAKPLRTAAIEIIIRRKETENSEQLTDEVIRLGADIPDAVEASSFTDEVSEALNLPAWALQEKTRLRRDKRERLIERKKQLEKFLVQELLAHPGLVPSEKLESIKDLFDDIDQKRILLQQVLKTA